MEQFQTTSECAGCGKELNLLQNHLVVNYKVRKMAFVTVAATPEEFDPEEEREIEDEEENVTVLGSRSGVGAEQLFHDFNCAADYFDQHEEKGAALTLRRNTSAEDPYNPEAAPEGGEEA